MAPWVCPVCKKELNAAPYEQTATGGVSQATDHLKGRRHLRQMRSVDISNPEVYRRFCIDIGRSVPDFDETDPLQDLKDYTNQCEGNGQLTMEHFAASLPLYGEDEARRTPKRGTERNIYSEPFATVIPTDTTLGGSKCKVRMLCCWDDKRTCNGCIRENCPFAHATKLAERYPKTEAHLYTVMPCNFAGMRGGCRYHQCFNANDHDWNWAVPVFLIDKPDSPRIDEQEVLPELVPLYDGAKWSLQSDGMDFKDNIEDAVRKFLAGKDDSEHDGSD